MITKPNRLLATVALLFAASTTFPQYSAAKTPQRLCVVLLDVSSSNSAEGTGKQSIAKARADAVDEGKLADVADILDACSRQKGRVELWAIDRNPRALRGPIVAVDFQQPKDDTRPNEEFVFARRSAVLCVVRGVVNIALTPKGQSPTVANTGLSVRVRSCPIRSDVSYDPQGTDIFGALDRARIYFAQVDPNTQKSLYVLTDGFNTSFDLNLYTMDVADPVVRRSVLAKAKSLGFIKPFGKVAGCMKGVGAQANGEVTAEKLKGLNDLWTAYFKAVTPPTTATFKVTDAPCWNEAN